MTRGEGWTQKGLGVWGGYIEEGPRGRGLEVGV